MSDVRQDPFDEMIQRQMKEGHFLTDDQVKNMECPFPPEEGYDDEPERQT